MPFIHFNSILHYNNQHAIETFFKENPRFETEDFIVQHKYDGSNFQIIFNKNFENDVEIEFARRNDLIDPSDNFNDYKQVLNQENYKKVLENIKAFLIGSNIQSINLYGELYGFKINKRIRYDFEKTNKIIFYDVLFDKAYKSPKFFINWANGLEIPIVESFLIQKFNACLDFDLSSQKTLTGDPIEGVVIKPYDHDLTEPLYLKKITPCFREIKPIKINLDQKDKKLNDFIDKFPEGESFESYLNENRVISVYSKKSWTINDIKKLNDEILIDALKDFTIDFPASKLKLTDIKLFANKVYIIIKEQRIFS